MKRYSVCLALLASVALGSALALADDPGPDTLQLDHAGGGTTIYQGVLLAEEASPESGQLVFQAHVVLVDTTAPDPCAMLRSKATRAKPCLTIPTAVDVILPNDGGQVAIEGCAWRKRDYLAEGGTFVRMYCT
jgi:hypothetical protein